MNKKMTCCQNMLSTVLQLEAKTWHETESLVVPGAVLLQLYR